MLDFDCNEARFDHLINRILTKLAGLPGRLTDHGPPQTALFQPVSDDELAAEEARLGFRLPLILKRLYTRIGNGGFGPGWGLLCLRQISPKVDQTIATLYHQLRTATDEPDADWPAGVVPFAEWGDFIFSCVDLNDADASDDPCVVRYEPNMPAQATYAYLKGAPFRGQGLIPERERVSLWLEDWLAGKEMFDRPYSQGD